MKIISSFRRKKMAEKTFSSLLAKAKERDSYWTARAVHEFTEDLYRLMEQRGVNKAELARRLDSSPAYVTKVLRGNTNFTIESMVRLARALEGRLCLHVGRSEGQTRWFDVIGKATRRIPMEPAQDYCRVSESTFKEKVKWEAVSDESYPSAA
jgi:transcriptional regulator with XRE-family HTH domain